VTLAKVTTCRSAAVVAAAAAATVAAAVEVVVVRQLQEAPLIRDFGHPHGGWGHRSIIPHN